MTGKNFAQVQFHGDAYDMDELADHVYIRPGDVTMIPRGIAHSVITDPPEDLGFLRLNLYSNLRWWTPNDLTQHHYDSYFECETTLIQESEWKQEMIAAAAE